MNPTIADIARLTNKSRSTVSRVLRDDPRYTISRPVREQILAAARKLNYVPQHSARSLATGKSYCVAAVLGNAERDLASPMLASMFLAMMRRFLKAGYYLTYLPAAPGHSVRQHVRAALRQGRVDGLYIGSRMIGPEMLAEVTERGVPVVTTEAHPQVRRSGVVSVVDRDYRPGMEQLAAALHARGHHRVGHVVPSYLTKHPYYINRLALFREIAAEAGLTIEDSDVLCYEEQIRGFFADRAEARLAAERNLDWLRRYTAIVTTSDLVAYGVRDALKAVGIEPGRDMALAGIDSIETSPNYRVRKPFLATIAPNMSLRGRRVAELLLERMKDPQAPARAVKVPARFVERESLADAPTAAQVGTV